MAYVEIDASYHCVFWNPNRLTAGCSCRWTATGRDVQEMAQDHERRTEFPRIEVVFDGAR
jgi:hypothetical protein